jgi:hypothetical protein
MSPQLDMVVSNDNAPNPRLVRRMARDTAQRGKRRQAMADLVLSLDDERFDRFASNAMPILLQFFQGKS